jgi:hypothetical protein
VIRCYLKTTAAALAAVTLIVASACSGGSGSFPTASGVGFATGAADNASPPGERKTPRCTAAAGSEPIGVNARFSPNPFHAGTDTQLTVTLTSPPCYQSTTSKWYTPLTITNILPSGLEFVGIAPATAALPQPNTCGGAMGTFSPYYFQLLNGTLSAVPGSQCHLVVEIWGWQTGEYADTFLNEAAASPYSAISPAFTAPVSIIPTAPPTH